MKKLLIFSFYICCFAIGISISNAERIFQAKMAPLSQEEIGQSLSNPNPPSTDFEKRVVNFSEAVAKTLLGISSRHPLYKPDLQKGFQRLNVRLEMTEKQLLGNECNSEQQKSMCKHTEDFIKTISVLSEIKHGHLIPWAYERYKNSNNAALKSSSLGLTDFAALPLDIPTPELAKDEFMVHFHVKTFDGVWLHLNVILSETAENELIFQRFFATPVPTYPDIKMPPGVLC